MLDRLQQLRDECRWHELRAMAPNTLPYLMGDDLAKAHLWTSKAYEETATGATEYRTALAHAKAAVMAAVEGCPMHTWGLGRVANLASDLGEFGTALAAGAAFLEALPNQPDAQAVAPWVYFHLGRVYHYMRHDYHTAAAWFRRAITTATTDDLRERASLFLAWTLAAAGRPGEAASVLPDGNGGQVAAARAAICFASGDWYGARVYATAALLEYRSGAWKVYDTVQAAEMYLILSKAAQRLGLHQEAARWSDTAAKLLSCWNVGFIPCLASTLRGEGGAWFDAAASHRGPAGNARCGLLGAVG